MNPAPRIETVAGTLPDGLDLLRAEARSEGHHFLEPLAAEWAAGVGRRGAFALGLDVEGKVIANLQDGSSGNYSPITTVREYGEWLYLGSLKANHMARLPLSKALQQ